MKMYLFAMILSVSVTLAYTRPITDLTTVLSDITNLPNMLVTNITTVVGGVFTGLFSVLPGILNGLFSPLQTLGGITGMFGSTNVSGSNIAYTA